MPASTSESSSRSGRSWPERIGRSPAEPKRKSQRVQGKPGQGSRGRGRPAGAGSVSLGRPSIPTRDASPRAAQEDSFLIRVKQGRDGLLYLLTDEADAVMLRIEPAE